MKRRTVFVCMFAGAVAIGVSIAFVRGASYRTVERKVQLIRDLWAKEAQCRQPT